MGIRLNIDIEVSWQYLIRTMESQLRKDIYQGDCNLLEVDAERLELMAQSIRKFVALDKIEDQIEKPF